MAVPTSGINSPHRARRYDPSADEAVDSLPAEGPVVSVTTASPAEDVTEPVSGPLEDPEDLGDPDAFEEPENGSEEPLVTGERFPSRRNPSDSY